jgi:hypothetical protein
MAAASPHPKKVSRPETQPSESAHTLEAPPALRGTFRNPSRREGLIKGGRSPEARLHARL